ncbi:biopolymer transporter Tol [Lonsdalea britannica]|uniref:DUF3748 domain-containing protein n=1 Tax=Lonsdalea britannica TaxID=1082704 RepID=UPI000A1ECC53|nr:DUF3748 domain-containing protein [Lonsdalea britannica]OSN05054.1 biopolymer transporter Tol [Lonsdalea britannica]
MNEEFQLTSGSISHQLTNVNIWTCDGQWVLYDVRPTGSSFTGRRVERVNIYTRQTDVVYEAREGACVGVITGSPALPQRYVFIHGPEHPDDDWHYDFHHRRGVIVADDERCQAVTLDALSITSPYVSGALRGGTHVHIFSPDGTRLSFTYNDHVLHERDPALDLRNVGVGVPLRPVIVPKRHPREYGGSHYCVLVSRTTPYPRPGSDEINRAYEEGWIGEKGYLRPDGSRQRWALAFIGDTVSATGQRVPEVFIVDLPEALEAYAQPDSEPLAGTADTLPSPPMGVRQRRLTFSADRRYPGVVNQPRHWLRVSPDGSQIAFLMQDDNGIVQLWTVSPNGGAPRQITCGPDSIQSAFTWHPNGEYLTFVCDNSIMVCDVSTGRLFRQTRRSAVAPSGDAVVFSPSGKDIAYLREIDGVNQIFRVSVQLEDVTER